MNRTECFAGIRRGDKNIEPPGCQSLVAVLHRHGRTGLGAIGEIKEVFGGSGFREGESVVGGSF